MNIDNIDDSPFRRRSKQPHAITPGLLGDNKRGLSFFPRDSEADSSSTRSPFSKLTNSDYDNQTSTKTAAAKGRRYSEDSAMAFVDDPLKLSPGPECRPGSLERIPLHNSGLAFSQAQRAPQVSVASSYQARDRDYVKCKTERNDHTGFGEELIEEPDARAYDSHMMPRDFSQSFKNEASDFSPPFQMETQNNADLSGRTPPAAPMPETPPNRSPVVQHTSGPHTNNLSQRRSAGPPSVQDGYDRAVLSRGSSTGMSVRGQSADYLPTFLVNVANDLRNTKLALEEKSKAFQLLREDFEEVMNEKESLSRRMLHLKEKAQDGLQSFAKKFDKMKNEFQTLGAQSGEFFTFANEAKTSLAGVKELRETLKQTKDRLDELFGENETYLPIQEWKSALSELQVELSSKQQINDLLRDRLGIAQGDLADAKNRIMELEGLQTQNNRALQSSSKQLEDSGKELTEITSLLKDQQRDNTDILTKNAELESRLNSLSNENSELQHRLSQELSQKKTIPRLQQEALALRELLSDRDKQIETLQSTKDRLVGAQELLKDRESKIQSLEASAEVKLKSIETLQRSLALAEAEATKQSSLSQRLEKDLDLNREQLVSESENKIRLLHENDILKSHEQTLTAEANKLRSEVEGCMIKLQQSDIRLDMLQERFEDQAVMLRMEKKSHGDAQERFLSIEASHAKQMDDLKRETDVQTGDLKGQIDRLEGLLKDRQDQLNSMEQELSTKLSILEAKHSRDVQDAENTLVCKSKEVTLARQELDRLKDETELLRQQVQILRSDRENYRSQLLEARIPSRAHADEVAQLKRDIDELRKINEVNAQRATNIDSRYEEGDLSIEEKKLVDRAHRAYQAVHEQELIAKRNEIRQRDHTIKMLEKRKGELESQLARVLNMQARNKAGAASEKGSNSLIDIEEVSSTQASSSPLDGKGLLDSLNRDHPITMEAGDNGQDSRLSVFKTRNSFSPTGNAYRSARVNVSPHGAPSFAKLSEKLKTTELSSSEDACGDDKLFSSSAAPKRKRAPDTISAEEPEKPVLRRHPKAGTLTKSRQGDEIEAETSSKDPVHVPKVKTRKRR